MNIEKQLETITPYILPNGYSFLDEQKAAILLTSSSNIVAGPGSGKTTVLIAKCAILLKQANQTNENVCLITHTNVAVDEIKLGLKKLGITNVEYPNFIGTIQDFFNTFFSKKGFNLIIKNKIFRVLDDEEYKKKFNELFERCKPGFYKFSPPNINKANPKISFLRDGTYVVSSTAKQSYKTAFESCISTLFKNGFVNNNQCLEIADWYITKYETELTNAISARFKYVFLDEAQDTSIAQYRMLKILFSDVIFQKFGDPYQALYNIFEDNYDAWKPVKELEETGEIYQEISVTTRFGSTISDIVKNVCMEKYDTFTSHDGVNSFNPYYIVYEDEVDLINQYKSLINHQSSVSPSYASSKRKDAIISVLHNDLQQVFKHYQRPITNKRKNESKIKKTYNFIINLYSKELDSPFKEIKKQLDKNTACKTKISICIKQLIHEEDITETFYDYLREILALISSNQKNDFQVVDVQSQIVYFSHEIKSENIGTTRFNDEIHIGTVHSVKGETHRSTLLILNTIFSTYVNGIEVTHSTFDLLKEYLVGNYTNVDSIENSITKNETIKSLKLAYVALSRPTHLMVLGIPMNYFEKNEEFFTRMNGYGWIKYTM